jgi:hypothetical protein
MILEDIITQQKINLIEQIVIDRFPEYHLQNKTSRLKLTSAQKKEVFNFLVNLALSMGLKPKKKL